MSRAIASILTCLAALAAGCEGPSFLAKTVLGEDKVKPVYTLPDRPTLVMVDDPGQVLANPILAGVIATNVEHHLKDSGAIAAPFVTQARFTSVRDRLDKEYALTPVDQVGRLAGAEQVIWIKIHSAMLQPAPGFYRPTASIELKVLDAVEGKRLFPEPPPIIEPGAPSRGHMMEIGFRYKGLEAQSPGQDAMLARRLAERVGRDVAQLFFEHRPDPKFSQER